MLVESRILTATYPEGYTPKRETKLMPPLPYLVSYVDDLDQSFQRKMYEESLDCLWIRR